jgi:hypothetical protein
LTFNIPLDLLPGFLFADMEVACDAGTIEIKADGNNVLVRLPFFKTAFKILTMLGGRNSSAEFLKTVDQAFKRVDITLFWQNTHFAILVSKAKPLIL